MRLLGLLVALIVAAPVLAGDAADTMEVPGGMGSVSRLLGFVSTEPTEFGDSVNRVLLAGVVPGHDWEKHELRALLVEYLNTVRRLEPLVGERLEIAGAAVPGRTGFEDLARNLGFKVKRSKGRLEVTPDRGTSSERRRQVAKALGWDLVGAAHALGNGKSIAFELTQDSAASPLDFEPWERLTGEPVDSHNALLALATDQRIGLVIEGMRRTNVEARDLLREQAGAFLYNEVPVPFYRYAAAVEVVDGALTIPGGPGAAGMWTELVGASPDDPVGFVTALLRDAEAIGPYLWHALFFAPPATAAYFTGQGGAATGDTRRYVRTLRTRLQTTGGTVQFDGPRGLDLGFAAFVRAVPVAADGRSLELPGGARLWYDAVRSDDAPESDREAAEIASRAAQNGLEEGEFVFKVLTERVDVGGYPQLVLPRLMRVAGVFRDRESLFTPTNAILVGNVAETQPMALATLDLISLASPNTMRVYLATVSHLGRLPPGPETHVLVGNFQGGVELLRILDQAGKVDEGAVEDSLRVWSIIHQSAGIPEDAAARELEWIVSLMSRLPDAPGSLPGRGPVERSLLAAMVPRDDPREFEWGGLDYRVERGRILAGRMASHLEVQQVPPADILLAIAGGLGRLRSACVEEDLASARRESSSLTGLFLELPEPQFDPPLDGNALIRELAPVDRAGIVENLQRIAETTDATHLPMLAPLVDDVRGRMGRELRPFLLAPAYLEGMGMGDSLLLADPMLIRRHTMVRRPGQSVPGDDPWQPAAIVPCSASTFGSHVAGHVGGVPRALIRVSLDDVERAHEPVVHDQTRELWLENAVTAPWHDVSSALSELVASLISTGRVVVEAAIAGGPAGSSWQARLCRRLLPLARLERERPRPSTAGHTVGSRVSPAELLAIGLAAVEDTGRVEEPVPVEVEEAIARVEEARAAVGDGWRRTLDQAGAPTPELTGRGTPWVGRWPTYEAIEREGPIELLNERELVDLRLAVIDYLGRHRLPGEVGGDLMAGAVLEAGSSLYIETPGDWESFLAWLAGLDDDFFDREMRRCLKAGLYTAQLH